jgi:hypothetical protein
VCDRSFHQTISGFSVLNSTGDITLNNNGELTSIEGFLRLITIDGDLTLGTNTKLPNVDGFFNVRNIVGGISIGSHSNLASLAGTPSFVRLFSFPNRHNTDT